MYIWYLIILTNLCAYLLYIFCCSICASLFRYFRPPSPAYRISQRLPHIILFYIFHRLFYVCYRLHYYSRSQVCLHYVVIMKSLLYRLHTIVWLWNLSYIVYTMLLACLCYLTCFITKLSAHMLHTSVCYLLAQLSCSHY